MKLQGLFLALLSTFRLKTWCHVDTDWQLSDCAKMAILENSDSSATPIDAHTAATHATVATMLAATGNQYLNPDYLSPMPSDVSYISNFIIILNCVESQTSKWYCTLCKRSDLKELQ